MLEVRKHGENLTILNVYFLGRKVLVDWVDLSGVNVSLGTVQISISSVALPRAVVYEY